jgi:hypothetical protein
MQNRSSHTMPLDSLARVLSVKSQPNGREHMHQANSGFRARRTLPEFFIGPAIQLIPWEKSALHFQGGITD